MRLLVDECLHTSLVEIANETGFEAHHGVRLGLKGSQDYQLLRRIQTDGFVFVTNNALDFLKLYSKESFHPGLIVIVPNSPPAVQRKLFKAALAEANRTEPTNEVIQVALKGDLVIVEVYRWP